MLELNQLELVEDWEDTRDDLQRHVEVPGVDSADINLQSNFEQNQLSHPIHRRYI